MPCGEGAGAPMPASGAMLAPSVVAVTAVCAAAVQVAAEACLGGKRVDLAAWVSSLAATHTTRAEPMATPGPPTDATKNERPTITTPGQERPEGRG